MAKCTVVVGNVKQQVRDPSVHTNQPLMEYYDSLVTTDSLVIFNSKGLARKYLYPLALLGIFITPMSLKSQ